MKKYIEQKINLYQDTLEFLESEIIQEDDFQIFVQKLENEKIFETQSEFSVFLRMISKIFKNHRRSEQFNSTIDQIFLTFGQMIKQTFTNIEIYNIFKSNKRILYILIKNKILIVDKIISQYLLSDYKRNYRYFFLTETKEFISDEEKQLIESEIEELDQNQMENIEIKRQNGENESYICTLIRQDSVEEFISFVNRKQIPLNSLIKRSIYETNPFLMNRIPTLIEYAAFFGSIQIFRFLFQNRVKLTNSLWIYSIHSNNGELIHLLEENKIEPTDISYLQCFIESIKCHHNDLANYILDNLLNQTLKGQIFSASFRYCNYFYFPQMFNKSYIFFYLHKYNYSTLVNFFLQKIKDEIEKEIEIIT